MGKEIFKNEIKYICTCAYIGFICFRSKIVSVFFKKFYYLGYSEII